MTLDNTTLLAKFREFVQLFARPLGDCTLIGDAALVREGSRDTCNTLDIGVHPSTWDELAYRYSGRVVTLNSSRYVQFEMGSIHDTVKVRLYPMTLSENARRPL